MLLRFLSVCVCVCVCVLLESYMQEHESGIGSSFERVVFFLQVL